LTKKEEKRRMRGKEEKMMIQDGFGIVTQDFLQ
jgi:hypothetical protein